MTKLAFRTSRGCLTRGDFPAVLLRCMVRQNVKGLTDREYEAGLEYTARKHPLLRSGSRLELERKSIGWLAYLAELVAEAVNQHRISCGTLAMAEADRETENQSKERGKTA